MAPEAVRSPRPVLRYHLRGTLPGWLRVTPNMRQRGQEPVNSVQEGVKLDNTTSTSPRDGAVG
jgi:hypothetical protein